MSDFEDRMVILCQKLTSQDCLIPDADSVHDGEGHSTLLHDAAALGLTRLVCSLLHWAAEHPGRRLGREVDALAKDVAGFTPLVSIEALNGETEKNCFVLCAP